MVIYLYFRFNDPLRGQWAPSEQKNNNLGALSSQKQLTPPQHAGAIKVV